jgi:putative ABC transport system permease protein
LISVALRGLAGRKLRAALTAIAIVLGVAMVSGTYVLTDTIDRAFNQIFDDSYAGTDVVVTGKGAGIDFQGDSTVDPPIPDSLLERVRERPGVEAATGSVLDELNAKILTKEGKAVNTQGSPTFGFGVDTSPELARFNPLKLVEGRWPNGSSEVVIDAGTADREGYGVGNSVKIATLKPARAFKVVGIAQYGEVKSLGLATFSVFDIPTAQALLEREGQFDAISVAGEPGTTPEQLIKSIEPVLPPTAKVRSATAEADEDREDVGEFISFIRYFLLAFAGIALFVGAFVIFNTLSITVAQRTREFATLRTIGASRRQVLGSVILEAFVIGLLASIVGLFGGLGLAWALQKLFQALELELPRAETVFAVRTIVVSLLIGVVVTVVAGLFPAVRATRVPPIAAVREGATLPKSRFSRFTTPLAILLIVLSLALLGYAMFGEDVETATRLLSIAGGVLLLFTGVAMVSSRLVRPLAAVVGLPARAIGGAAGTLARGNSIRNPGRTASTAAALMIGIALVTFVAVLANGMKASNRGAIEDQVIADYVTISQDGFTPFVAGAGDAEARSDAADLVTSVRSELGEIDGHGGYVTGIEPDKIAQAYRFDWKDGSDAVLGRLGPNDGILDSNFAEDHNVVVGDTVRLLSGDAKTREIKIVATYEPPPFYPLLGSLSITKTTFDELNDRPRNQFTFANVPGDPTEQKTEALEQSVAGFPDAKVLTREDWITDQDEDFNQFLTMLYVLLALSVIVSLFGMVNTLVLSVFERTREVGMLRAVGLTRRQTRRMIRHESVITALIGAALGLPLGIFLAALVTQALSDFDVRFQVPVGQLILFAVVAVFVGIFAAILPARRAARLNVLQALQYE